MGKPSSTFVTADDIEITLGAVSVAPMPRIEADIVDAVTKCQEAGLIQIQAV